MNTPPPSPSLLGQPTPAALPTAPAEAHRLLDLLYDGFYMLLLMRDRHAPLDAATFRERLKDFLQQVDRGARRLQADAEDIYLVKYAFCALVDERVLGAHPSLRQDWERRPLQLELFGEQLAGEHFFDKLEACRQQGAARLQALEVFHLCLLLGFQGRYLLEGTEKLGYLTARLGDEIAHHKGQRAPFAPHWQSPDHIRHQLRHEVPLWVAGALFALAGLVAFMGLRWHLDRATTQDLAGYQQLVRLPAQQAHVTITLP